MTIQNQPRTQHAAGRGSSGRFPLRSLNVNASSSPSPAKQFMSKPTNNAQFRKKAIGMPMRRLNMLTEKVDNQQNIMKSPFTPCLEEESSECCGPQQQKPLIFRESSRLAMPTLDDNSDEDRYTLKRASPIYDSDDDESYVSTPSKRRRTIESSTVLMNDSRITSFNGYFEVKFES